MTKSILKKSRDKMDGMSTLSLISIAEQQITFFAVALAAILLWNKKRKLKRKMLSLEGSNGASKRSIAIVIGIGNDPLASVENFLKDQNINDIRIIKYIFPGHIQPNDYLNTMIEINKLKDDAQTLGVNEVLLFYAGLVDLAIHTGASFCNWVPIKVFAFDKIKGTYEFRFTLTTETSRMDSLADQISRKL